VCFTLAMLRELSRLQVVSRYSRFSRLGYYNKWLSNPSLLYNVNQADGIGGMAVCRATVWKQTLPVTGTAGTYGRLRMIQ
jgi:hypothetical protein